MDNKEASSPLKTAIKKHGRRIQTKSGSVHGEECQNVAVGKKDVDDVRTGTAVQTNGKYKTVSRNVKQIQALVAQRTSNVQCKTSDE